MLQKEGMKDCGKNPGGGGKILKDVQLHKDKKTPAKQNRIRRKGEHVTVGKPGRKKGAMWRGSTP